MKLTKLPARSTPSIDVIFPLLESLADPVEREGTKPTSGVNLLPRRATARSASTQKDDDCYCADTCSAWTHPAPHVVESSGYVGCRARPRHSTETGVQPHRSGSASAAVLEIPDLCHSVTTVAAACDQVLRLAFE